MDQTKKWGTDVDTAVELALEELGCSREDVEIEVLEQPSKGFFGIGQKLALVQVTRKDASVEKQESVSEKAARWMPRGRAGKRARAAEARRREAESAGETEAALSTGKFIGPMDYGEEGIEAFDEKTDAERPPRRERQGRGRDRGRGERRNGRRDHERGDRDRGGEHKRGGEYDHSGHKRGGEYDRGERRDREQRAPMRDYDRMAEEQEILPSVDLSALSDITEHATISFLRDLMKEMALDIQVSGKTDGQDIYIFLDGRDSGTVIGKRGATLDAIQYLTSLVANKAGGEYTRVVVDAENYRAKREKALEKLAFRLADKVVRTHRSFRLEPMNPYERKIIHATLQKDDRVTTRSEGQDPYRRVIIELR